MELYYDYKIINDNGGTYYLFVQDFGGAQLHDVAPTLYCFASGDRAELVKALEEIMTYPDKVYLNEWSGWGDIDDPAATLEELQELIDDRKGGAVLVADGNIYA